MNFPILTSLVLLPVVGAVLSLVVGRGRESLARRLALGVALLTFALSVVLWARFDAGSAEYQFVERHAWLPDFGASYHVGVDGISLLLIVLTTFLTPIAMLCSWESVEERVREFGFFLLLLEASVIGAFISIDLFLFYLFWDAMLVPAYFLIGVWGYERRVFAALKFMLYTTAGSLLMLLAIIWIANYHQTMTGVPSFDVIDLYALDVPGGVQTWLFAAFVVAFAIKVPLFPLHTWLPDAYVQSPTASVVMSGVLLKMGTYGLLRFAFPLFPQAAMQFAPVIALLAVIGVVYAALIAMVQVDMKRLVAYSSVSHLGVVVLGLTALNVNGVHGALFQMLAHGISAGGLFIVIGMLAERRHTRQISEFGGLRAVTPKLVGVFLLLTLASIALPGTSGFVGEFLIFVGAYNSHAIGSVYTVVAATAVILSAVYMLWLFQRINYGPLTNEKNRGLRDLSVREWLVLAPMVVLSIFMGVFPGVFLKPMEPAVRKVLQQIVGAPGPAVASLPAELPAGVILRAEQTAVTPAPVDR